MSTLETIKSFLEASLAPTPTVITIGALFVLLFPILLHYILTATTPYATLPAILLVGPSGAGKTALLTLFERGPLLSDAESSSSEKQAPVTLAPFSQTHTSQAPGAVELSIATDGPSPSSYRDDLDSTGSSHKKFLLIVC